MDGCFSFLSMSDNKTDGMVINDAIMDEARAFLLYLYGREDDKSLDVLHAYLWSFGKCDLRPLHSTEDTFRLHVSRAVYQLTLYKRAHLADRVLPEATQFGREVIAEKLLPDMMTNPAKPDFIKSVCCKRKKKSKCLKACPCFKTYATYVPWVILWNCSRKVRYVGRSFE